MEYKERIIKGETKVMTDLQLKLCRNQIMKFGVGSLRGLDPSDFDYNKTKSTILLNQYVKNHTCFVRGIRIAYIVFTGPISNQIPHHWVVDDLLFTDNPNGSIMVNYMINDWGATKLRYHVNNLFVSAMEDFLPVQQFLAAPHLAHA